MAQKEINIDINLDLTLDGLIRYAEKEQQATLALGIGNAKSEYTKEGLFWKGITTWVDPRNNKPMIIETKVRLEIYGFKKFKDYHYETFLNGVMVQSQIGKTKNQRNIKDAHTSHVYMTFLRMKNAYHENPATYFSGITIDW